MNCSHARRILYPEPEKAATTIETPAAREHLRVCASCQSYFQAQAEWSRQLKEKAGIEPAPDPLRERIAGMIEQHQSRGSRHGTFLRRRRTLIAALVVFVMLLAGWLAYRISSQRFFEVVCDDHAKYLNADSQVRSPEPSVIESWFRNKTEFGVRVPAFEKASLVGGRLCFLKKRKAALIFYRKHDRTVSLFQFNSSGLSLRALDRAVIDGVPIWRASFKGYSLAAFEHRGVIYVLVSDLRESELLEMASAAQMESRGY